MVGNCCSFHPVLTWPHPHTHTLNNQTQAAWANQRGAILTFSQASSFFHHVAFLSGGRKRSMKTGWNGSSWNTKDPTSLLSTSLCLTMFTSTTMVSWARRLAYVGEGDWNMVERVLYKLFLTHFTYLPHSILKSFWCLKILLKPFRQNSEFSCTTLHIPLRQLSTIHSDFTCRLHRTSFTKSKRKIHIKEKFKT